MTRSIVFLCTTSIRIITGQTYGERGAVTEQYKIDWTLWVGIICKNFAKVHVFSSTLRSKNLKFRIFLSDYRE